MEQLKYYVEIKNIRNDISEKFKKTRESSLVITKLDEALMWLDRYYMVNHRGGENGINN